MRGRCRARRGRPAAVERGGEPELEDLGGEALGDDAAAHREHVGVVVLPAEAGRVEIVAEGGPHAVDLVGGDLLALAGAAEHDAAVGLAGDDRSADGRADRRVVDRLGAVGAEVDRLVAEALELLHEVRLEVHAGVVGSDGDLHARCPSARLRTGKARSTTSPSSRSSRSAVTS